MNENCLLITTALEQTWFKDQDFTRVFLTEACRLYSRKGEWQILNSEVLPYHWNDRKKLKTDHDYLKSLYDKALIPLTEKLNDLNKVSESVDYWRIIVGPWLITYISILFDRWEMIRIAFTGGKKMVTADLPEGHRDIIARDFDDFIRIMQTDEWNFQIYHKIIQYKYHNQATFLKTPAYSSPAHTGSAYDYRKRGKFKILVAADKFLKLLSGNNKILIYQGYFSPVSLAKLNFSFGQVPRMYLEDFNFQYSQDADTSYRSEADISIDGNDFEEYFFKSIFNDMPAVYLESFAQIRKFVDGIHFDPEKIVTANAYWGEDVFKYWLAIQKNKGKKIVISHHGGSIPPLFDTFCHEEDIADKVVTWFKPYHQKHIQLPPNKLCGINISKSKGGFCSLIAFESPRFGYRATAGPITNRVIDCFNQNIAFCEALKPQIRELLKVRPYPDMGWQTKLRFIDKLGISHVDSDSYKNFISNSRLLVCTYPQTTFSEAMASGKPVILLYIPEFNEPAEGADELVDILREAKILFSDALEAAAHINSKWEILEEWWETADVINARNAFHRIALNIDANWSKKWSSFLKSV